MTSFKKNFTTSAKALEEMKGRLKENKENKLMNLMHLMDSPLFKQLVSVEDSIEELGFISSCRELKVDNFDINLNTGELIYFSRNASHRKPVLSQRTGSAFNRKKKKELREFKQENMNQVVTFTNVSEDPKTETLSRVTLNKKEVEDKKYDKEQNCTKEQKVPEKSIEKVTRSGDEEQTRKTEPPEKTVAPKSKSEMTTSNIVEITMRSFEGLVVVEVVDRKACRVGYFVESVNGRKDAAKLQKHDQIIKINDSLVTQTTTKSQVNEWLKEKHLKLLVVRNPEFEFYFDHLNFVSNPLTTSSNSSLNDKEQDSINHASSQLNLAKSTDSVTTPTSSNSSSSNDCLISHSSKSQLPSTSVTSGKLTNEEYDADVSSTSLPHLSTSPLPNFNISNVISDGAHPSKSIPSITQTNTTSAQPFVSTRTQSITQNDNNFPSVIFTAKHNAKLPDPIRGNLKYSPKPPKKETSTYTNPLVNPSSNGASIDLPEASAKGVINSSKPIPTLLNELLTHSSSPPSTSSSTAKTTSIENSKKPAIKPKPRSFQKFKNIIYSNITGKGADKKNNRNDPFKGARISGEDNFSTVSTEDDRISEDKKDSCKYYVSFDVRETSMVLNTEWTHLKLLHLVNHGSGLGFGITGGKSTGVVVKTIQEGGAADMDSTLKLGDHILQICDVNVRGLASEQVAAVLRQSGTHVRLLVARPLEELPLNAEQLDDGIFGSSLLSPIVQTRNLSQHIDQLNAMLSAYPDYIGFQNVEGLNYESHYDEHVPDLNHDASTVHINADNTRHDLEPPRSNNGNDSEEMNSAYSIAPTPHASALSTDLMFNRNKTPKRLSLATVFEMTPLDTFPEGNKDSTHHDPCKQTLKSPSYEKENKNIKSHFSNSDKYPLEKPQATFDCPDVVEYIETVVEKNEHGLGMTVVGYAADDEKLTGLFVRSIVDGSDVHKRGVIRVNDQIIKLDGKSLENMSNQDAVEVLKKTDRVVNVTITRHVSGRKHDLLQHCLDIPIESVVDGNVSRRRSSVKMLELASQRNEESTKKEWRGMLKMDDSSDEEDEQSNERKDSSNMQIIVAHVMKLKQGGGLGMVLEGLMDDKGVLHPFHFIRSIYPRGPIAVNEKLKVGDEVLEVNGIRIHGMDRSGVVEVLKKLSQNVCIVAARQKNRKSNLLEKKWQKMWFKQQNKQLQKNSWQREECLDAIEAVSGMDSFSSNDEVEEVQLRHKKGHCTESESGMVLEGGTKGRLRSMSLEPVSKYRVWSNEVLSVELDKGDKGLGFSVMDYKNPSSTDQTIILIRSLVPGGVAHMSNEVFPGDRLVFVNRISLYQASLHAAVAALKSAPKGKVVLGVLKALPLVPCDPLIAGGNQKKSLSNMNNLNFGHLNENLKYETQSNSSLSPSPSQTSPLHSSHLTSIPRISNVCCPKPPKRNFPSDLAHTSQTFTNTSGNYSNIPELQKGRAKVKKATIPLSTSADFKPHAKPTRLPLPTFRAISLPTSDAHINQPVTPDLKLTLYGNFPSSLSAETPTKTLPFTDNKKFKSEKNIMNLDQMLSKSSTPTSYSEKLIHTNFQKSPGLSHKKGFLMQEQQRNMKQLKPQYHQSRKGSLQSPRNFMPSLTASPSLPSSSMFAQPCSNKNIHFPLRSITIRGENLFLGVSIESFKLTNTPSHKNNSSPNNCDLSHGFIIKQISPGLVKEDGRLRVGDVIVAVGNQTLEGLSTYQAFSLLKSTALNERKIELTYIPSEAFICKSRDFKEKSTTSKFVEKRPEHSELFFNQ